MSNPYPGNCSSVIYPMPNPTHRPIMPHSLYQKPFISVSDLASDSTTRQAASYHLDRDYRFSSGSYSHPYIDT